MTKKMISVGRHAKRRKRRQRRMLKKRPMRNIRNVLSNVSINPSPPLKCFEKVVTKQSGVGRHVRFSIIESKSMKTIHMGDTSVQLNLLWYLESKS